MPRTLPNVALAGGLLDGEPDWGDDMNLNLLKLSVLVQGKVIDKVAAEPGSPTPGDTYILDETHATHANTVAVWDGETGSEAWVYFTPHEGWLLYNQTDNFYEKFDGTVWAAFTVAPSFATTGDVNTGTDTTKAINSDVLAGSNIGRKVVQIPCTDPAGSAISVGDGQGYFVVPPELSGMNLVDVDAALVGAQSTSGLPTVQVANQTDGVDILSTKCSIDANEWSSYTAATAAVIDTTKDDVATGDILRIDVDVAGTGAKGLVVILTFQLP